MRIFRTAQDDSDDMLLDILREQLREWEPRLEFRWGRIDSSSSDNRARIVADRERQDAFIESMKNGCASLGVPCPSWEFWDNDLVVDWNDSFIMFLHRLFIKFTKDKNSWWFGGPIEEWRHYSEGDKVRLSEQAQYSAGSDDKWRETLKRLTGKIGVVSLVFPGLSSHINVNFDGEVIGIDKKLLVRA
jgi:hypothetical protein